MTEEEAKTKWCPFARDRAGAGNRVPYGESDADPLPEEYIRNEAMAFPCIGSACMAWRHFPPEEWGVTEPPFHPDNKPVMPEDGYCGLAGKP